MKVLTLDDVCYMNMGQSPDSSTYNEAAEGLPFYQGNADFGEKHPQCRVWCSAPTKIAEKGDILISVRAPIGALNEANERCCIGRGLAAIRPKGEINKDFLYYFLLSKKSYLISKGTGSTFKAISKNVLRELSIPVPTLPEQENRSRILNTLWNVLYTRRAQLAKLDELVKCRFVELFGELSKYKEQPLKDTCSFIDYRGKTPIKTEYGIPLITAKNVGIGVYSWNPREYIDETIYDSWMTRGIPRVGDILFTTEAPLGHVCRIPEMDGRFSVGQRLIVIQPNPLLLDYDFVSFILQSHNFQEKVLQKSTGSTVKGIRSKELIKLSIPVPPLTMQQTFSSFVTRIDKLRFVIRQSLDETQKLFDSLMQEYFE